MMFLGEMETEVNFMKINKTNNTQIDRGCNKNFKDLDVFEIRIGSS